MLTEPINERFDTVDYGFSFELQLSTPPLLAERTLGLSGRNNDVVLRCLGTSAPFYSGYELDIDIAVMKSTKCL